MMSSTAKRGRGRPLQLTGTRLDQIIPAMLAGASRAQGARVGNISETSFRRYMRRGDQLRQKAENAGLLSGDLAGPDCGEHGPDPELQALRDVGWRADEVLLVEFADRVHQAEAAVEIRCVAVIAKAAEKDWRAALWLLSRRFRERWATNRPPGTRAGILDASPCLGTTCLVPIDRYPQQSYLLHNRV